MESDNNNATKISVRKLETEKGRHELTLQEGLDHRLPDLQWRPGEIGRWQHGGFQPYPWQQSLVEPQCLPLQPNSAKDTQTKNEKWNKSEKLLFV